MTQRALDEIKRDIERIEEQVVKNRLEIAVLKTKLAIYSAGGASVPLGIFSLGWKLGWFQ